MADLQERIREEARSIFQAEGLDGISMRRVAAGVGVSATAIYLHFADKDALINSVVDEGFAIFEEALLGARRKKDGRKALMGVMDAYATFTITYPRYYAAMFLQPRQGARRFPEDLGQRASASFNVVLDLVSDLIEEGEFMKDDPLEVTLTIWSLCHGYAALYLAGRFGDHPNRFRRLSRAALRRMLEGLLA